MAQQSRTQDPPDMELISILKRNKLYGDLYGLLSFSKIGLSDLRQLRHDEIGQYCHEKNFNPKHTKDLRQLMGIIRGNDFDGEWEMKMIVIGDKKVGKTHVIQRYVLGETISDEFEYNHRCMTKTETLSDQSLVNITILDGSALKLQKEDYKEADCIVICYDVTNEQTFENAHTKWVRAIQQYGIQNDDVIVFILGCKGDLSKLDRAETEAKAQSVLNKCKFTVYPGVCSAKNGDQIDKTFRAAAQMVYQQQLPRKQGLKLHGDADADKAIQISKLRKGMNSKLKQVQNQCEQLKGHNKKLKSQSKSTEKSLKEKDQMIQTLKQQQNERRTKYDANHAEEVNKIKAMMEDKLKLQTEKHDSSIRDLQEQLDTEQTEQQEKEREYAKSLQKVNDDKMNTKKELEQATQRLQEQDEQLVAKQREMDQKQKECHGLQASLDAKQRECTQNEERLQSVRTETKQQMERFKQRQNGEIKAKETKLQAIEAKCETLLEQYNKNEAITAALKEQNVKYELEMARLKEELREKSESVLEETKRHQDELNAMRSKNNANNTALESEKKLLETAFNDKEAELQSMTAEFDALSVQHNEMVASQHGQKTEYESKALESTRLHEELKVSEKSLKEKEQMIQTLTQQQNEMRTKYDANHTEEVNKIKAMMEDKLKLQTEKHDASMRDLQEQLDTAQAEQQEKEREYAKSLQKVNDELKHARKRLQEQDEQLVTKQQEMDQKQKECHGLQASLDAKQRECMQNEERLRSVRTETKQQMERLQQQLKAQYCDAFEDERNALERRLNGEIKALENDKKVLETTLNDKEAELQSMTAESDALSEQQNEMVAAQHEQNAEYESKALVIIDGVLTGFCRNISTEDLAAMRREYAAMCKENNTRIAALEEDKSALEKRLNEYEATQKDRNAKYELEVLENTAFLNTRLKEELQEKEREYAKSLQKVNDDKMNTKKELKQARKRLQEQDEQLVAKQREMDPKQKECHGLQASLDAKQRECTQNEERLRSVRTETKQQMERLQQQLKSQHAAFQDERNALERRLNGKIKAKQTKLQALENEKKALETELNDKEMEVRCVKSRCGYLNDLMKRTATQNENRLKLTETILENLCTQIRMAFAAEVNEYIASEINILLGHHNSILEQYKRDRQVSSDFKMQLQGLIGA